MIADPDRVTDARLEAELAARCQSRGAIARARSLARKTARAAA